MKRFLLLFVTLLFSAFAFAAVNINTATREELDALPEIGPVKAQAIIDYRNANGPFKTPDDIMKVNGIKAGTFGKVKGMISVGGASTPVAARATPKADTRTAAPSGMPQTPPGMRPPPAAKSAAPAAPATGPKTMKAEKAAADKAAKAKAKADAAAEAKAKKDAKAAAAQAKKDAKASKNAPMKDAKTDKTAAKDATKGDAAMKSSDKDEKAKK